MSQDSCEDNLEGGHVCWLSNAPERKQQDKNKMNEYICPVMPQTLAFGDFQRVSMRAERENDTDFHAHVIPRTVCWSVAIIYIKLFFQCLHTCQY